MIERQRKRGTVYYTRLELIAFCEKSKNFQRLFATWLTSGCQLSIRPTIDRVDPLKNYSLDNIQVLTYSENNKKGNSELIKTKGKKIIQKNDKGKIINRFNSIKEAGIILGINPTNICNALRGRLKTFKNCIWEYDR